MVIFTKSTSKSWQPVFWLLLVVALRRALINATPTQGMIKANIRAPQKMASTRYSQPTWVNRARKYMAKAANRAPTPLPVINSQPAP